MSRTSPRHFCYCSCMAQSDVSGRSHEKLQSDPRSPPDLISWMAVIAGVAVALGLFMGLIVVVVKKRKTSKVHPQSSHAVTGRNMNTVIEQHHETIYSTVDKPGASQNPPANNTEATIYDTPSRHPRACQVNSVTLMIENPEQQRSGHDRTVQVFDDTDTDEDVSELEDASEIEENVVEDTENE
ncbi:hypothetical protein PO909_024610 [Leuciscus waleckii]